MLLLGLGLGIGDRAETGNETGDELGAKEIYTKAGVYSYI